MTLPEGRDEAARQQALMASIADAGIRPGDEAMGTAGHAMQRALGLAGPAPRARAGLSIYRANAAALAERALGAAYPTLQSLLGAADFGPMAREFWRDHPPQRGDIGTWGEALPDWLHTHAALARWPYLADCARLDLLRHACERARDGETDAVSLRQSLGRLEHDDPAGLTLRLQPGVGALASAWPVASIFEAHQAAAPDFDAARRAIAQRQAQAVLVARQGYRAQVIRIDLPTCRWLSALLAGRSIAAALDSAGPAFDLAAWLADALRGEWVQGVACGGD